MKVSTEQNIPDNLSLSPRLTKQQAEQIYEQGKAAVVFALLQLAKMAAESKPNNLMAAIAADPSTPSAQKAYPRCDSASKVYGRTGRNHLSASL